MQTRTARPIAHSCTCATSLVGLLANTYRRQESYTVLLECLTSQTSCNPANSGVKFRSWALVPDTAKQCDTTGTAHTHTAAGHNFRSDRNVHRYALKTLEEKYCEL